MKMTGALASLGITTAHLADCKLPPCEEAAELVDAGQDIFERPQRMTKATRDAWVAMSQAAESDGITIQLVSAFRSVQYQCDVIQKKLDAGRSIDEILDVNAPPGYSEHHTGRALDLTTPGVEVLTEAFESTRAFDWLTRNAEQFRFFLSYPRDNPFGVVYEPWHWAYRP